MSAPEVMIVLVMPLKIAWPSSRRYPNLAVKLFSFSAPETQSKAEKGLLGPAFIMIGSAADVLRHTLAWLVIRFWFAVPGSIT
jgi:hypothetical protein